MAEEILVVDDLRKWFPIRAGLLQKTVGHVKAVDGVSLQMRRGETYGLVGESGSGKTTLGKSILRLIEPTGGTVLFDGFDVTKAKKKELKKLRSRMQMIFQDPYCVTRPPANSRFYTERGHANARIGSIQERCNHACQGASTPSWNERRTHVPFSPRV